MKNKDCIFCKIANGEISANALYEDDVVKVIFDLGPASRGHVLILPKNHFNNIYDLDEETAAHIFKVAVKTANAIKDALEPEGLNIVQNNGELAGQTVFHFHMHLIPRYKGDNVHVTWTPGEITEEEVALLKEKIAAKIND